MLKRELIRILATGGAGLVIGVIRCVQTGQLLWLLLPLYLIGTLYAGLTIVKLVGDAFRSYFHGQLACLWSNPLWGTLICLTILFLSLAVILSFGWLIGIVRCVWSICTAVQEDRMLNEQNHDVFSETHHGF